jgi:pimeloyl-ACP methyl ester carboxylesterase
MSTVLPATAAASSAPSALRPAPWPVRLMFGLGARLAPSAVGGFVARRMLRPARRPAEPVGPGEAEVLCIADRERQLHALSWGVPGQSWVLLMHGWEGRCADMQAFVAPLTAAGLRVVALDAPAHGESPGEQTDVHDIARAIAALAVQLGAPSAIVAHSLGAAASAVYLSEHQPTAPGAPTAALALLAPGGDLEDEIERVAAALGLPPAAVEALRAQLQQHYRRRLADCSTRAALRTLNLRGMVVHDRDDRVVRHADGVAASRALAGARLLTTQGLGHRRILRDPQVIAEVVAFCRGGTTAHQTA